MWSTGIPGRSGGPGGGSGAPEVGQAQLQLLPRPVAGDVVGGGSPLVLRRDGGVGEGGGSAPGGEPRGAPPPGETAPEPPALLGLDREQKREPGGEAGWGERRERPGTGCHDVNGHGHRGVSPEAGGANTGGHRYRRWRGERARHGWAPVPAGERAPEGEGGSTGEGGWHHTGGHQGTVRGTPGSVNATTGSVPGEGEGVAPVPGGVGTGDPAVPSSSPTRPWPRRRRPRAPGPPQDPGLPPACLRPGPAGPPGTGPPRNGHGGRASRMVRVLRAGRVRRADRVRRRRGRGRSGAPRAARGGLEGEVLRRGARWDITGLRGARREGVSAR